MISKITKIKTPGPNTFPTAESVVTVEVWEARGTRRLRLFLSLGLHASLLHDNGFKPAAVKVNLGFKYSSNIVPIGAGEIAG